MTPRDEATVGRVRELEKKLRREVSIRRTAESVLRDFKGAPCIRVLLGEDASECLCIGCQARGYFRVVERAGAIFDAIESTEGVTP